MNDDTFELELTAMAHGGSALGRHSGKTIFVPFTIPGEVITGRIVEDKGRVAFAEGITLLEASADRVFPACAHFGPGKCGRCQWQHIAYPAQLLLKQDVLADQLERIGGFSDVEIAPVIPSPRQWGYNHQITLQVQDGVPGFKRADGLGIHVIDECHIMHPALLELLQTLDLDFTALTQMTLRIGSDGVLMLIISTADDNAPELHTDLPLSINLLLSDNEPVNLIGDSHTRYTIAGRNFRVTAGSGFRANIAQLEALAAVVLEMLNLRGSESVLDLYAGVGFFSAFIAERTQLVTLIESYPPAVTDADENLVDYEHVDVIEGAVERVLPELDDSYHAAVLDPPDNGLSTDAIDLLGASNLPRLVYVSSDPATLARDGKRLDAQGFHLEFVQPLDLAPHTYHIDSVALFIR
ncbi:MAG: class I SAM-dependent RNA methyltransferase [Chloroflexi bacterium]|nr:MAG: class I SAM-dependent RNA methyltransferase [Chloroflexota bacterium]